MFFFQSCYRGYNIKTEMFAHYRTLRFGTFLLPSIISGLLKRTYMELNYAHTMVKKILAILIGSLSTGRVRLYDEDLLGSLSTSYMYTGTVLTRNEIHEVSIHGSGFLYYFLQLYRCKWKVVMSSCLLSGSRCCINSVMGVD